MDDRSHLYCVGDLGAHAGLRLHADSARPYRRGGTDGRRCWSNCLKNRLQAFWNRASSSRAHGVGHRAEAPPRGLGLAHFVGAVSPPRLVVGAPADGVRGQRLAQLRREDGGRRHLRVGLVVAGKALHDLAQLLHPLPRRLRIHVRAGERGRPGADHGVHRPREALDERLRLGPCHGRRLVPLALERQHLLGEPLIRLRLRAVRRREHGLEVRADLLAGGQLLRQFVIVAVGVAVEELLARRVEPREEGLRRGCVSPGRPAAIPPGCA